MEDGIKVKDEMMERFNAKKVACSGQVTFQPMLETNLALGIETVGRWWSLFAGVSGITLDLTQTFSRRDSQKDIN